MSRVDGTVLPEDQIAVLRLMSAGDTIEVVARKMDISERTVRRRARSACDTLGCETTIEAIVWAVRHGHL